MFLDLIMEGMNGEQVLDWVSSQNISIKIIIMTAYENDKIFEELEKKGAIAVLNKPFENILDLPKLIEQI